jgi:hypothetical protein
MVARRTSCGRADDGIDPCGERKRPGLLSGRHHAASLGALQTATLFWDSPPHRALSGTHNGAGLAIRRKMALARKRPWRLTENVEAKNENRVVTHGAVKAIHADQPGSGRPR